MTQTHTSTYACMCVCCLGDDERRQRAVESEATQLGEDAGRRHRRAVEIDTQRAALRTDAAWAALGLEEGGRHRILDGQHRRQVNLQGQNWWHRTGDFRAGRRALPQPRFGI